MVERGTQIAAELSRRCIGPQRQADLLAGSGAVAEEIVEQLSPLTIRPVGGGECTIPAVDPCCTQGEDAQVWRGQFPRGEAADCFMHLSLPCVCAGNGLLKGHRLPLCPGC